jgi:hypothetical protein
MDSKAEKHKLEHDSMIVITPSTKSLTMLCLITVWCQKAWHITFGDNTRQILQKHRRLIASNHLQAG